MKNHGFEYNIEDHMCLSVEYSKFNMYMRGKTDWNVILVPVFDPELGPP